MATAPETQVAQFISGGQRDRAVDLLSKLALASARKGEIAKSEGYRDQLYELDGMALADIVRVNEAIEAQKTKFLTDDYRCQWAPFFEHLSSEEANAFFFGLKTLHVGSEKVIFRQGRANDKLFLIHQGQLRVTYLDQDKDLLIGTLGRGDIIGQETFFSVNVSTVTVKTLSPVNLKYLDRATLDQLKGTPNFSEANLKRACSVAPSLVDRLRQKGIDRRSHKRFQLKAKLSFTLLSSRRKVGMQRAITAELWDISKTGISFYFRYKNREAVRSLIGRTLGVQFEVAISGRPKTIAVTGVVNGVGSHPLDEYSVHMKLKRNFSDAAINAIRLSA